VRARGLVVQPVDWLPAAIVTAGVAVALVPFFVPLSGPALAALALASLVARSIAPVHQHCHAHFKLFTSRLLNHAYDTILMLAAGNTTAIWEAQHVIGHHGSLLDREKDPAWTRRFTKSGPCQRLIFTFAGDLLSFTDSLRIARSHRRRASLVRRLLGQTLLQALLLGALIVADPALALLLFVGPALLLRWSVFYFSYAQHHEAPGTHVYDASITHFGWTNALFLNVGHHTAHHEKPTLHWSLLPRRTAQILDRIPESCRQGA
jgi:beta-carotene hydroxylase